MNGRTRSRAFGWHRARSPTSRAAVAGSSDLVPILGIGGVSGGEDGEDGCQRMGATLRSRMGATLRINALLPREQQYSSPLSRQRLTFTQCVIAKCGTYSLLVRPPRAMGSVRLRLRLRRDRLRSLPMVENEAWCRSRESTSHAFAGKGSQVCVEDFRHPTACDARACALGWGWNGSGTGEGEQGHEFRDGRLGEQTGHAPVTGRNRCRSPRGPAG